MFRRFCLRSRSLLATLLAISLVSASLWGYSAEAMADVLSDEISFSVAAGDAGDHVAAEKLYNHGCHAQTHLTGLDSREPALALPATEAVFSSEESIDVASHPCDDLFRPPRNTFQA